MHTRRHIPQIYTEEVNLRNDTVAIGEGAAVLKIGFSINLLSGRWGGESVGEIIHADDGEICA